MRAEERTRGVLSDALAIHVGLLLPVGLIVVVAAVGAAAADIDPFVGDPGGPVYFDEADARAERLAFEIPGILWLAILATIPVLWALRAAFGWLAALSGAWAVAALVIFFALDPFV